MHFQKMINIMHGKKRENDDGYIFRLKIWKCIKLLPTQKFTKIVQKCSLNIENH